MRDFEKRNELIGETSCVSDYYSVFKQNQAVRVDSKRRTNIIVWKICREKNRKKEKFKASRGFST